MWQKFDMEKMIPSLNLQFSSQDPVMEGSSAMSPLGEPSIPMIAACAPALSGDNNDTRKSRYPNVSNIMLIPCVLLVAKKLFAAMESVNSVQNQDFSDATSFAEINSPMLLIVDSSTPEKKSFSQDVHAVFYFNIMYVTSYFCPY